MGKITDAANLPEFMGGSFPDSIEVEPAQIRHNWMYAMIPADGPYQHIYLAGYCKVCQQAVTRMLPSSIGDRTTLTQLDIPRYGCIDGSQF